MVPARLRWIQAVVAVALAAACLAAPVLGRAGSSKAPDATQVSPRAQSSGQRQVAPEVTTIRAYSNLVVIDVVVTDSQGNPIHGLKASDFTLLENNQLQTMRHFEEHTASTATDAAASAPSEKLPPGMFTNKTPAPANGPVNVLLLDYLNTPLESQPFVRKQLQEFLGKAPAGTRIAIFGMTQQLSMLQGFTSDMSVLKAALASKKGAPQAPGVLLDPIGDNPSSTAAADVAPNIQVALDDLGRFQAMQASFAQELRAKYTLNAFDTLARYLVGIPGRKNVIWFSGGFPLDVEPGLAEADPNDSVVRNDEEIRKTDNLLARAQVAVYPVDARGVMTPKDNQPLPDYDKSQQASSMDSYSVLIGGPNGAKEASSAFSAMEGNIQTARDRESMFAMAEDTGGEAFINTNGLAQAVTKAIEHGSNYYTLSYSPTNTQWDARFRSVKVKVSQSGMKLTYRNGYYALDPNDRNKLNAQGAATALAETNTMTTAMMHGGPEATEIQFKVRVRLANGLPHDALPGSNQANPKVKLEGPYRQYAVDLVPAAKSVNCREEADGHRQCALEMWTFVYNKDGVRLITASNRIRTVLTAADYANLLAGGLAFHQQISVPVKGDYYVRTAIHDLVSDKVGAVEVPVEAVARLDPLQEANMLRRRNPSAEPATAEPVSEPKP